jgi:serine/threonine-protein kinase ATR
VLLNQAEGMLATQATPKKLIPLALEACWTTGRWDKLDKFCNLYNSGDANEVFNVGLACALSSLRKNWEYPFQEHIRRLRSKIASSMSYPATSSLQACHDAMLKAHILTEMEIMHAQWRSKPSLGRQATMGLLNRRLELLGAYVGDKQYVLGIRRATMEQLR